MDHISFNISIKRLARYGLLMIILSWSMTFASPNEEHQNLIRNELEPETEDKAELLPFKHLNDLRKPEQFDPKSLQKSLNRIAPTIERLTTRGEFPRQSQKSPTQDLVKEALDYGYIKLSRASKRPSMEKSSKDNATKIEESLRSQKIPPKGYDPQITEFAAEFLKQRLGTVPNQIPEEFILRAVNESTYLPSTATCETTTDITCTESRYQSIDGTCNNLEHPSWGSSGICQLRLLPACYEDGVSKMRSTSVKGEALPSGLFIANRIICIDEKDNNVFNMWSLSVSQLLAHDIGASTPGPAECCPVPDRSECLVLFNDPTIILSPDAPCIYTPRTQACEQCTIGPRNVITSSTAFVDFSPIYGSDLETAQLLRLGQGGLLSFDLDKKGRIILPKAEPGNVACAEKFSPCVNAGDFRAVQNPGILLLQALGLRFHNKIAGKLSKLYPTWSDEMLYQEARKVVILQWQRIVYEEFLPLLLGKKYYRYYQLDAKETYYSSKINPGSIVEVNAAAYRIGHTMIKSYYKLLEEDWDKKEFLRLKPNFNNPNPLFDGKVDPLSSGLLYQPAAMVDVCYAKDVFKFLFWTRFEGYSEYAFNLAAADVERGRDHGVQPYPAYVQYCFGTKIDSWKDLESIMSTKNIERLQSVYKSVWDVDLWTGGLHESTLKGGMIGPTFGCLVGIQFYNLKYGDRYFYTHYDWDKWYPAGLNIGQFQVSPLHNLICIANKADSVLERPLEIESYDNPPQSCDYSLYQYTKSPLTPNQSPKGHHGSKQSSMKSN